MRRSWSANLSRNAIWRTAVPMVASIQTWNTSPKSAATSGRLSRCKILSCRHRSERGCKHWRSRFYVNLSWVSAERDAMDCGTTIWADNTSNAMESDCMMGADGRCRRCV